MARWWQARQARLLEEARPNSAENSRRSVVGDKPRNNTNASLKSTNQNDRRNDQCLMSLQVKYGPCALTRQSLWYKAVKSHYAWRYVD